MSSGGSSRRSRGSPAGRGWPGGALPGGAGKARGRVAGGGGRPGGGDARGPARLEDPGVGGQEMEAGDRGDDVGPPHAGGGEGGFRVPADALRQRPASLLSRLL